MEGPVNGKETQLKRFNDNYFEARDSDSGVTLSITRSADGSVQMSYTGRHGANGVCSIRNSGPHDGSHASFNGSGSGSEVTCESQSNDLAECDMNTQGNVEIVRQLSRTQCVEGRNWGLSCHSVWVKDGCRAVFRNVSEGGRHHSDNGRHSGYQPPVAINNEGAAELLGACNVRAGNSGALVTRVPVNADVTELIIDYPDGRYLCMARNDGFVQSLTRMKR